LTLVAALLINLLVVVRVAPPDGPSPDHLPIAARCQGGSGCAEQPLIPPPVGGMPHFDPPPAPAFGALILVLAVSAAVFVRPAPFVPDRPPILLAT
jgi:hypothetical protein